MDEQQIKNDNKTENVTDSHNKIQELEEEKKKLRDEFNAQRAKMKDLFIQKENELKLCVEENKKLSDNIKILTAELDDFKSQVVAAGLNLECNIEDEKRKANEEIASLTQLVQETIEESSSSQTLHTMELERLHSVIQHLQTENNDLRLKSESPHHTNEQGIGPSVLNVLTKNIAKKLGADSFSSQDSDDSIKKGDGDHPYEDPEILKSLIEPLEDQIKALKEKLRSTDEQLQKCRECGHFKNSENETEASNIDCENCQKVIEEMQERSKLIEETNAKLKNAESVAEKNKEELMKEINFRKEIEEKWTEKRDELKQQISTLTVTSESMEADLKNLRQLFEETRKENKATLSSLTKEREQIRDEIHKLQLENDNLVGKYSKHSAELQSEAINLPVTVEELHELVLKNHQDLIIAKIGKESSEEKVNNLQSQNLLLKDQIDMINQEKNGLENRFVQEISYLKEENVVLEKRLKASMDIQEKCRMIEKENSIKIQELQQENYTLTASKDQLIEANNELKSRITSLQQELDNCEAVQKDFVLLSQSLQVQLERIRGSDSQVRWQHEDDVDDCPTCQMSFTNPRQKINCRHCGRIFCPNCLSKTVNSGPNMRPSKVCDVCHTLLVKSSAPYFSKAPPCCLIC